MIPGSTINLSKFGCAKLHVLFQEKFDSITKTDDAFKTEWIAYLNSVGLKRTKIEYALSSEPGYYPTYEMQFPNHNDVLFILDPHDQLYLLSVPKKFAFRAMTLGFLP